MDRVDQVALSIPLSEQHLAQLRAQAECLGVSVEELARASILDLIARPDDAFERAAQRVLEKNAKLYERLG